MEYISCNDIISSLWSPLLVEKCKLGLCDVVVFENNLPVKWLVTSTSGDVKQKRTVDMAAISKRWTNISEQLNSFYVAAIRQDESVVKFLSAEAWKNFVAENKFEGPISSLHSVFGTGASIVVYRNAFSSKIVNGTRSVTSQTQTYTISSVSPVYTLYLDQVKLQESKATQINKVINLATSTIVRFVEKVLKITITELVVDFIIDERSQIWMLWTKRSAFTNHEKPSFRNVDMTIGNEFAEDVLVAGLNRYMKEVTEVATSKVGPRNSPLKTLSSTHTFIGNTKLVEDKSFPNPFNCQGDFCNVCIQGNGALAIDNNKSVSHTATKFFSDAEIERLRKDPRFNSMMEFGSSGFGVAEISKSSIYMARKEQRGKKYGGDSFSWKEYPASDDTKIIFKKNSSGENAISDMEQSDTGDYPYNFSLHYETVKVCGVCYNIYCCLDWARECLQRDPVSHIPNHQASSSNRSKRLTTTLRETETSASSKTSKQNNKATWKHRLMQSDNRTTKKMELNSLENYVRGESNKILSENSSEPPHFVNPDDCSVSANVSSLYFGQVLLACSNYSVAELLRQVLLGAKYRVVWFRDGREAINEITTSWEKYDCIIAEHNLELLDCFELCRQTRSYEKSLRLNLANSAQRTNHRLPIICCTEATSPIDLSNYMRADMDGCISVPIFPASVLSTVRAAVPHHLSSVVKSTAFKSHCSPSPKIIELGLLGESVDSDGSATTALKTLPISKQLTNNEYHGIAQLDADTKIPFMVLNGSKFIKGRNVAHNNFFNLVVCHDLFDTYERMKIIFQPIVQRYQSLQILIWNYPGQANTEWRSSQLLNNDYLAGCLNELLGQIGEQGTKEFATEHPFYILGYGYGANIASFYLSHYRAPNVRGIISINGWAYVDSYLAGVMHDCVNIFHSTPSSRPDLPVYFFSRYLFSKDYLTKVSVPLALNIYTAVYNAITIEGRIQLCRGVLQSTDIRKLLKSIDAPVICLHSNQNAFCRPMHVEPFVVNRNGEVRSIYASLQNPSKTCVVWMNGGHEVFQENKKQVLIMIEQILTGYHEIHEITFPSAGGSGVEINPSSVAINHNEAENISLENKFTKTILNLANRSTKDLCKTDGHNAKNQNIQGDKLPSIRNSESSWEQYSDKIMNNRLSTMDENKLAKLTIKSEEKREETTRLPYISDVRNFPEVKEYMNWRLKRNKKRLQRLQIASQTIQNAFRAFVARKFVKNIRKIKAASIIQRVFRGWRGKRKFYQHARRLWGSIIVQKNWRGYAARKWYFNLLVKIAAASDIQRIFRGYRARRKVSAIKFLQNKASAKIQSMFRMFQARKEAWRRRLLRNSAISVQRIFRGFIGRKRSLAEREKYIFSKSQSQGIEFGRQMLLEHKLHVTKLQTDVSLLSQEKTAAEEQIEALLEEIGGFEEGVRVLEKEMHQLSKIESEAAAFMDEDSRFELREQKMRLDREFGEMLSKITNRKDMLNDLERKLAIIDKSRQAKEEDLRTLERKLVVLLEDQQKELNAIKRKQDVRGTLLVASHQELSKVSGGNDNNDVVMNMSSTSQSGPSLQEKKQAAQLMQSTETLMKFGFMSMSMTYFSSLNMIKALRTVSVQDTVMAALAESHIEKDERNPASSDDHPQNMSISNKRGKLPGQQQLQVSSWSVTDVANWLQTLSLGQYSEAFIDSAIDGEFLFDLNDDDLKNTLGIEHRLHRKKILNCINRLKQAEVQQEARLGHLQSALFETKFENNKSMVGDDHTGQSTAAVDNVQDRSIDGPKVPITELFSLVRHSKFNILKDSIDYLPSKPFDKSLVQSPYVADHGTVYLAGYERLPFHINKTDEFGNTLLVLSCQNGNTKICKFLLSKGANPNHQNRHGQTAAHFAIAYQFYDLSQFLFEQGADDTVENKYGLTPYDGLSNEADD